APVAYGEGPLAVSYDDATASEAIADAAGNPLADFDDAAVANSVPPPALDPGAIEFTSSGPGGIACASSSAASGGSGTIAYQWRRSDDGGDYADLDGKTSADLGLDDTA